MSEHFSHEDRMRAGEAALSTIDAIEDTDVFQHLAMARDELLAACDLLRDKHGFDDMKIGLALMGVVFAPMLDRGGQ